VEIVFLGSRSYSEWLWLDSMCLLIESQCSEEAEEKGGGFINSVYLKHHLRLISINSSDFRKLIFCHWTVLYYLWLKWKPGNAAAMEERCIANDVAYASLHNQLLGKQRIKHSTGQGEETGAKCYIHISLSEASVPEQDTAELFWCSWSSSASPFEHESVVRCRFSPPVQLYETLMWRKVGSKWACWNWRASRLN